MEFAVITLFPDQVESQLRCSITGRALRQGLLTFRAVSPRDFPVNSYGKVDDSLAGGGRGMLMRCEPIQAALDAVLQPIQSRGLRFRKLYLSPKGRVLHQGEVEKLAQEEALILLCGHYEGVDTRVLQANDFEEISLGDYVLTGGELGANVLMDAVARLIPGVLPDASAYECESHHNGLLEEPQYTKPAIWEGHSIPEVLLNGDHQKMQEWKAQAALMETLLKRPDLFMKWEGTVEQRRAFLEFYRKQRPVCPDERE